MVSCLRVIKFFDYLSREVELLKRGRSSLGGAKVSGGTLAKENWYEEAN